MKMNKKLLSIILAMVLALSVLLCACDSKPQEGDTANENTSSSTQASDSETTDSVEVNSPTEVSKSDVENQTTDVSEQTEDTTENQSTTPSEIKTEKAELSVAEIVSLYNTSANKIKKDAKQITRNYKKLSSVDKYLSLPSSISSIGKWAMNTFVKGSDEAHIWTTKEDFKIGFPVGNTDYTSKLTESMVKSAKCKETATTYEITIILKNDAITSPKKGQGYSGVFNTVTASTFEEINVPGVKFETVKVNGINGEIRCTMNKATKEITDITFKNTDILDLGVKVAGSNMNAKFALASEENFTIAY